MKGKSAVLSKYVWHPLWDIKDRSIKLKSLRALNKTQWLDTAEIEARQWKNLKRTVAYAYENCEYYRELFDSNDINPLKIKGREDLARIPVLTKRDIREEANGLISKKYRIADLKKAKTGGSTGTALEVYFDKQCEEMRNAAALRSDMWANYEIGERRAAIWGNPPVAKSIKEKLRSLLIDRTIYLDTMSIDEKSMADFVQLCGRFRPTIFFGHSHSIFIFAKYLLSRNITNIRPKGVISTSMMLLEVERKAIEAGLGCRVTNRYGCEEVGLIACECEVHGGMHINSDHLYVEVLNGEGLPAEPGEEGKIVVTDLINRGMPLIRYRVEDIGVLSGETCVCGRGLPLLDKVVGRVADFLIREDGRLVAGVSLVERTLTAIEGIEQMQIIQDIINKLTVLLVGDEKYGERSKKTLVMELKRAFGENTIIEVKKTDKIQQDRSGKYRFAICNVEKPDER